MKKILGIIGAIGTSAIITSSVNAYIPKQEPKPQFLSQKEIAEMDKVECRELEKKRIELIEKVKKSGSVKGLEKEIETFFERLGMLNFKNKNYMAAIGNFQFCIDFNPSPLYYETIGHIYEKLGYREEAKKYFDKMRKIREGKK